MNTSIVYSTTTGLILTVEFLREALDNPEESQVQVPEAQETLRAVLEELRLRQFGLFPWPIVIVTAA